MTSTMARYRSILVWLALAAAGALLLVWAFPRAFPFLPPDWRISRDEAVAIALESFRDLGEPVADAYVEVALEGDVGLERRLLGARPRVSARQVAESSLGSLVRWEVRVFRPKALDKDWTYRARVAPDGRILAQEMQLPPDAEVGRLDADEARVRADDFLRQQGFDLARFAQPEVRVQDRDERTDLTVRYRDRGPSLGPGLTYGVQVGFAGDRLTGYSTWHEDPDRRAVEKDLAGMVVFVLFWQLCPLVLSAIVAGFFMRRYHEGVVGVRRGVQIFLLLAAVGVVYLILSVKAFTYGWSFGPVSRQLTPWLAVIPFLLAILFPTALVSALSWSVGESICRERWGHKLAAFDALLQGDWANATVARSALRGVAAGILLSGGLVAATLPLQAAGAWPQLGYLLHPWWASAPFPGLSVVAFSLIFVCYFELFGRLLLVSAAVRRLGRWLGAAVAVLTAGLLLWPPLTVSPVGWSIPLWLVAAAALVGLFLAYDLLTVFLAALWLHVLPEIYPLFTTADASLAAQGWLAVGLMAVPLIASLRHLGSGREFTYRYDDIPPHVRRIAERERQRVELETARGIQSSILPELPPQLHGVEIAHSYLPATEVGGDFYDVLALDDGRLALAVGDVAGHGVSSGLIMSMAKSALAVQVTFNPEVGSVFRTLNRMVYQSARKRLLTTLCYAVLDPASRELVHASAGHLYPYRVSRDGHVEALEAAAYPLGVRRELEIAVQRTRLLPGDTLFLFSDGVVEARRGESDEVFGFRRLEESLRRHAGQSVERLRDGVLADVAAFTGPAPREDDQTVLVLRLPES